jgi:hypothetical protein
MNRKHGELILHEDNAKATVTPCYAKVESEPYVKEYGKAYGCLIDASQKTCDVWMDRRNAGVFLHKHFEFEPSEYSSEKEAERFAVLAGEWTLYLYQWTETASYSVELWKGNVFKACVEWFNHHDGAVTAYAEGNPSTFLEFAEKAVNAGTQRTQPASK